MGIISEIVFKEAESFFNVNVHSRIAVKTLCVNQICTSPCC